MQTMMDQKSVGTRIHAELDAALSRALPPEFSGPKKARRRVEYVCREWLAGRGAIQANLSSSDVASVAGGAGAAAPSAAGEEAA